MNDNLYIANESSLNNLPQVEQCRQEDDQTDTTYNEISDIYANDDNSIYNFEKLNLNDQSSDMPSPNQKLRRDTLDNSELNQVAYFSNRYKFEKPAEELNEKASIIFRNFLSFNIYIYLLFKI